MMTKRSALPFARIAAAALLVARLAAGANAQGTERVSVNSSGGQAKDLSALPSLSSDGRLAAFTSGASNLVPGDNNGHGDVFVHDRNTGTTEIVSLNPSGAPGDNDSSGPSLSSTGQFVAFWSAADDLVSGDTNGAYDAFVRDRFTGITERVSVSTAGVQGNDASVWPVISADGRFVAFESGASNLVAGDSNGKFDVFVHDRSTGTTERVSISTSGAQANQECRRAAISSDGRFVAFQTNANNLVAGDTNGSYDVFVRDRQNGTTERVSIDSSGTQGNNDSLAAAISADGSLVAFHSYATNLVAGDTNGTYDIFVHDRTSGATERVSLGENGAEANSYSQYPSLSADGRFVAFMSLASNLVSGDTNFLEDIFVRDRVAGLTVRASVDSAGTEANGKSGTAALAGDGSAVGFESEATNLVAHDTNGFRDVFAHDHCIVDASWTNYGAGWPGTLGVPAFTASSNPVLGTSVALDLEESSGLWTWGVLFVGLQRTSLHTSLGGDLLVVPLSSEIVGLAPVGSMLWFDLPSDEELCGIAVDLQVLEVDPGASEGVSFTQGLELVLGH